LTNRPNRLEVFIAARTRQKSFSNQLVIQVSKVRESDRQSRHWDIQQQVSVGIEPSGRIPALRARVHHVVQYSPCPENLQRPWLQVVTARGIKRPITSVDQ
jgi:hypothetical protein